MSVNKVEVNGVEHEINDARLNPLSKTPQMTTPVGVDENGKLFAQPYSDEEVAASISAWFEAHPEAATYIADGSITKPKLDSGLIDELTETDDTMTLEGVAADAKKVGELFAETSAYTDEQIADAVSSMSDAISGNSAEIATQKARIDGIVALPDGSTTADAELVDMRVGAYSKNYDSAGNAARYQFEALDDNSSVDLIKAFTLLTATRTHLGVTYDYDRTNSTISISGTSTGTSIANIIGGTDSLSAYFKVGKTYYFICENVPAGARISIARYVGSTEVSREYYTDSFSFVVEDASTAIRLSIRVANGVSVSGTMKLKLLSAKTNDEIYESIITNDRDARAIVEDAKKAKSKFTPLQNVTASGSSSTFVAGKTYSGIPYSNRLSDERMVLFNLSLESVFTQFKNPYSEIYAFDPTSSASESKVWCGSVCSTWVSWATNRPMNMVVDEVGRYLVWKMKYNSTLGVYEKECDLADLEVGDVLWQKGEDVSHCAVISGFQVGLNGIEKIMITEMWKPTFVAKWYSVEDFWFRVETGCRPNMNRWEHDAPFSIGRFADDYKIRTLPKLRLVDDIITNKGDNVHFEIGEDVWTYITDANHTLTITKPDGTTTTVDYTTLPKKSGATVYNLKSVLTGAGVYRIKGEHGTYASRITMYNAPNEVAASKVDNTITVNIGTHEGLKLVGFMMITLNKTGKGSYPIPADAAALGYTGANAPTYKQYHDALAEDTTQFTISTSTLPEACYIRIYYETGCGLTYKDSGAILPE